jgi:hypothetical protein
MSKMLNMFVIVAIILNLQVLTKGTRVYDSFNTNFNYILGAIW